MILGVEKEQKALFDSGGNCFEISLCETESQQIKRSKPILDMADYFCLSGYFHSLSALISKNVGFQWVAALSTAAAAKHNKETLY